MTKDNNDLSDLENGRSTSSMKRPSTSSSHRDYSADNTGAASELSPLIIPRQVSHSAPSSRPQTPASLPNNGNAVIPSLPPTPLSASSGKLLSRKPKQLTALDTPGESGPPSSFKSPTTPGSKSGRSSRSGKSGKTPIVVSANNLKIAKKLAKQHATLTKDNLTNDDRIVVSSSKKGVSTSFAFDIDAGGGGGETPTSKRSASSNRLSAIQRNSTNNKDDENLGEEFESTPWLPPSIEKAEIYQRNAIFRNGDTRIDSVDIINATDLSPGINLYFSFAMVMTIVFFFMTLFSIPSLLFVSNGQGISIEDRDPFGLYHFTLGNLGYDAESTPNYVTLSQCNNIHTVSSSASTVAAFNETCIHVSIFGNNYELTTTNTAYLLTFFEMIQITIFLLGIAQLYLSIENKTNRNHTTELSVSDYAVMVTNLPPDASENELIQHFNELYALNKRDWKGRPIVIDAEPVETCGNTGLKRIYKGTWISECIVHKAVGKFLSSFKSKKHLMENLFRCRAKMKMYGTLTPHSHGPDTIRYDIAEQAMLKAGLEIDRLTERNIIKSGLKVILDEKENEEDWMDSSDEEKEETEKSTKKSSNGKGKEEETSASIKKKDEETSMKTDSSVKVVNKSSKMKLLSLQEAMKKRIDHKVNSKSSIYYHIDAETTTGFVTFQYGESLARCVEDYLPYSSYLSSLQFFYPERLKFRGQYEIHVVRAPEPGMSCSHFLFPVVFIDFRLFLFIDQVIWENLEVPYSTKFYKRMKSTGISIFLILICFIFILQASIYKESFSSAKPDLSLCSNDLPALYLNESTTVSVSELDLVIPPSSSFSSSQLSQLNQRCDSISSGSFYAVYDYSGNEKNFSISYDFNRCSSSLASAANFSYGGFCPKLGENSFCPCVSTSIREKCLTVGCLSKSISSSSSSAGATVKENECKTFPASTIGSCYCYQQLLTALKSAAKAGSVDTSGITEYCTAFYYQYSVSTGLTYGSVIATTIVNVLLRKYLKELAKNEAYISLDEFQASVMTKIFFSNFATMGLLVLVAYGNAGNDDDPFLNTFHLMTGPYHDFTRSWYGNVGLYLMSTFILQSFSPLIANLLMYFFIKPILRLYHFRKVK
jgi:hypothetical protein